MKARSKISLMSMLHKLFTITQALVPQISFFLVCFFIYFIYFYFFHKLSIMGSVCKKRGLSASVANRYRKSISIIELFVSMISIYTVWYKTNFGSQKFGYQFWCILCNSCNVFKNMFNVGLIIILPSIVVEGFPTTEIWPTLVIVLPIDIENPFRLSNCLYR